MKPEQPTRKYHRSEMMAILCLIAYGVNSNAFGEFSTVASGFAIAGFIWYFGWTLKHLVLGE